MGNVSEGCRMTDDELRASLASLIDRYVTDQLKKAELHTLVVRPDVTAKGVLAKLDPFLSDTITESDRALIKRIAFFFC